MIAWANTAVAAFYHEGDRLWVPIDEETAHRLHEMRFQVAPIQWALHENMRIANKERRRPHAKK